MGLSITGLGTSQKREIYTPPVNITGADEGIYIESDKIRFGTSNIFDTTGQITGVRYIPYSGNAAGTFHVNIVGGGFQQTVLTDAGGNQHIIGGSDTMPVAFGYQVIDNTSGKLIEVLSGTQNDNFYDENTVAVAASAPILALANHGGLIQFWCGNDRPMEIFGESVYVGKTSANDEGSVYALQVGDGTADTRSVFRSNNAFALGLGNGTSNARFFLGATTGANPGLVFSNTAGTQVATLNPSGVFAVFGGTAHFRSPVANGYGLGNFSGVDFGINGDAGSGLLNVNADGGDIVFNSFGAEIGRFQFSDVSLRLQGDIATNGGSTLWRFGAPVAAAVAFDNTQYLEVWVNGTPYRLALAS